MFLQPFHFLLKEKYIIQRFEIWTLKKSFPYETQIMLSKNLIFYAPLTSYDFQEVEAKKEFYNWVHEGVTYQVCKKHWKYVESLWQTNKWSSC